MVEGKRIRHALEPARWPSEAEARASRLFSPIRIGRSLELRERTWVPAMVPWRATESGEATEAVIAWYGRFAEGRPGAIVVEATGIRDVPSGPLLRMGHDRFVPGLAAIVDAVRARSGGTTRLFIQAIDFLAIRRRPPPEKYFSRFLVLEPRHRRALADLDEDEAWIEAPEGAVRTRLAALAALDPGALPRLLSPRELDDLMRGAREQVTDMHLAHIRDLPQVLPELFAGAARRAEQAGFDGLELHFAHAYTMASFLSRLNDRGDGYGTTLEGRARLPLEVFRAVRSAVGPDFVVGCRFLGDEAIDGGSPVEDAVAFGVRFAEAGMDFLSVSKGGKFEDAKIPKVGHAAYPYTGPSGHECMPTVWSDARGPFGRNLPLSRAVRAGVRARGLETPVVGAGGIASFDRAEAALREGDADVVAAARQSLADPDWWAKMRSGRGGEIRRCSFTSYCEGLDQQHKEVTCRLWDREPAGPGERATLAADGRRRLLAPGWSRA